MLKFYKSIITTYNNEHFINSRVGTMLTENPPKDEIINVGWNNVEEVYKKEPGLAFNIWNFKKGRRVSFFTERILPRKNERDVKEWKEELNIKITIKHEEYNPPINEVLKWHNSEKAI